MKGALITGVTIGVACVSSMIMGGILECLVYRQRTRELLVLIENDEALEGTKARYYVKKVFLV